MPGTADAFLTCRRRCFLACHHLAIGTLVSRQLLGSISENGEDGNGESLGENSELLGSTSNTEGAIY